MKTTVVPGRSAGKILVAKANVVTMVVAGSPKIGAAATAGAETISAEEVTAVSAIVA